MGTRDGKSKSLIRWKRLKGGKKAEKGGKGKFDLQLDFLDYLLHTANP